MTSKRYYPPEWEKQKTVWLSWPHNVKEWGEKRLSKIKRFYKELISIILNFQDVNLLLTHEDLLDEVVAIHRLPKRHQLKKMIIPNNDIWIRDYGPFFIGATGQLPLLLDFKFNSWGRKFPPWNLDNNVPKEIALYLGCKIKSYPIVLEGGATEFSGDGLLLTTEQCLLNKNRNPKLLKKEMETILKQAFNIEEVIWLEEGLKGDHTDGHVDNVARFIGKDKILVNKGLETKAELLQWARDHKKQFEITELPLPNVENGRDHSLPASYANFIFVNGGIIVPTFNCETDKVALEIFKKVFPTRKIMNIDCSLLIEEGGGLHCITKQEPFS